MMFGDNLILKEFEFRRTPAEEEQANAKALELIRQSPYKDQLTSVGIFLKALAGKVGALPNLTTPQFGNPVAENGGIVLLPELLASAEADGAGSGVEALPLSSRVRVDPWSSGTELIRAKPVALMSEKEKMPFAGTPVIIPLKRQKPGGS